MTTAAPVGLDDFVQQAPQADAAPEQSGPPPGLDDFIAPELSAQAHSTLGQQALAGIEGVAKGFAGPVATGIEKGLSKAGVPGLTPEDQEAREQANPWTHGIGETVGFGAGMLTGSGEAALLGKAAELAPAASEIGRIGSLASKGAIEMGLLSGGDEISKAINDDPNQTAGSVLAHVGLSAAMGAGGGAFLGKIFPKWGEEAAPAVEQGLKDTQNAVDGTVPDTEDLKTQDQIDNIAETAKDAPKNAEVVAAARSLGLPELEGIVTDNTYVKKAEDALLNSAPTFSSVARTKAYKEAYDLANTAVDNASQSANEMSETDLGNHLKESLGAKLDEQYAPIKQLYGEIEPYRQAIPISDRSTGSLGRTISKIIEDQGLVKGTERHAFVQQFADGIEDVDNLQKLANFRSEVSKSAGPNTKDIARIISDKLDGVEERAIKRFADTMKSGEAKDKILDLIDKSDSAKRGYAQFRGKLQELGNVLGKKKIYGPQNFMDFLENMNPQQLTKRIFKDGNTEFAQYFSKEFPEEFASVRDYQRSLLKKSSFKAGEFNPKLFIKNVFDLEPETQKLLFSKDELKTLKNAGTYLNAFPKSFNPSGTDHMRAFRSFAEGPTGVGIANIRDATLHSFIKTFGRISPEAEKEAERLGAVLGKPILNKEPDAESAKHSTEYVLSAIKGMNTISKSADALFNAAKPVVSQVIDPTQVAAIDKKAKEYQIYPDKLEEVGGQMHHYLPNHDVAYKTAVGTAVNYLNSIRPTPYKPGPLDAEIQPSELQMRNYNRAVSIVNDPLSIVQMAKQGTLTPEDVNHVKAAHPALYPQIQKAVYDSMLDHLSKGEPVPFQLRAMISTLTGEPLDSGLTYQSVMSNQAALNQAKAQGPMPQPQTKVSKTGMRDMDRAGRLSLNPKDDDS